MNIVAYCRVSTEKEDQLNSLDTQKRFFEEYAEKNNHNLVKIYADEGISGTKIKNRTQFQRLLKDAKHGLFDLVVVKDISRFARNTVDLLNSTRELKGYGIEMNFLTANMTLLGQSEFVLTIFGALAQEESSNTSKRVKFGKKMNAEKGRVPNRVYGYDKINGDYFNLQINQFEANVVRRIFDLYINSGQGANKITQILNAEGIRTKRNCKWSQNAICRILENEIYIGKIVNGKEEVRDFLTGKRETKDEMDWIVREKPELRLIDDETFYTAAKIRAKRLKDFVIGNERQSNKHLFSTVLRCSCCGYSFRRVKKEYKNTYIRWTCSGRCVHGASSCLNTTKIDEEELKQSLKEYFMNIIKNKDKVVKNIVAEFNRIYKTKDENIDYEKELEDKLKKANKDREKYINMYEDDLITREELKGKVSELNKNIEKYENDLKLVQYNLSKSDQMERVLDTTLKDLDNIIDMDTISNAQLRRVVDKILVDENGKVDVYLKLLSDIGLDQTVVICDDQT